MSTPKTSDLTTCFPEQRMSKTAHQELEPTRGVCGEGEAETTNRAKHLRGMSLLEIMVVITLIGLVASVVTVAVMNQLEKGELDTARNQAMNIGQSIDIYKVQHGKYPTTAEGLNVLANPPKGKPIMDRVPQDPWGQDYIYVNPGQKNTSKFDVRSKGPDGQEGTEDDVGNWPE